LAALLLLALRQRLAALLLQLRHRFGQLVEPVEAPLHFGVLRALSLGRVHRQTARRARLRRARRVRAVVDAVRIAERQRVRARVERVIRARVIKLVARVVQRPVRARLAVAPGLVRLRRVAVQLAAHPL
jgi:hypothetical protein